MTAKALPPVTLIKNDFTGAWAIPAGGLGVGDYMQVLGYNHFLLNTKCDRDAQVYIQLSEDHVNWYTLRDKNTSAVLAEHANGTLAGAAVTITPSGQLKSALLQNTHTVNTLSVSFDGVAWKAISPMRSLSVPTNAYSYQINGATGTTYEIINNYFLYGFMAKANVNMTQKFYAGGSRYIRVLVQNLDAANALAANVDIKAMEAN